MMKLENIFMKIYLKIYKYSQFTLNLDKNVLSDLQYREIINYKNYILIKLNSGNIKHL